MTPFVLGCVLVSVGIVGLSCSVWAYRRPKRQPAEEPGDVATAPPLAVARLEALPTQRRHTSETSTNLVNLAELTCTCDEYREREHLPDRDFRRACRHIRSAAGNHFQGQVPTDIGWAYVCPPPVVPIASPTGVAIDEVQIHEHAEMTLAIGINDRLPWLDVIVYDGDGRINRYIYGTNGECAERQLPDNHRDIVEALWLGGYVDKLCA